MYEAIDFSREPDFLQQELFKSVIRGKKGKRVADQIVKVYLKNGGEQWILIHVEVQDVGLEDFQQRMFQYFYRIYDKYEREICAIALITSEAKDPPDAFRYSFFGTELQYKYNVFLLSQQDPEDLERSSNPFAMAVLAGIYANKTKDDVERRYRFKRELLRNILKKAENGDIGRSQYVSALFYFIELILELPDEFAQKLRKDIQPIISKEAIQVLRSEEFMKLPTLADMLEKWKKEGIEEERERLATELLKENFADEQIAKLTKLSVEEVLKLKESIRNER